MSEIRDPIYGFIEPTPTEFKVINTSLFQRLRKVKQLAMANLVYPGSTHSRFTHCLGVLYISSIMAKKLLDSEEQSRIIRFAALLHDVGHGPFSHVSEYILDMYSPPSSKTEKIHEVITTDIVDCDKELSKILSENERKQVIGLLTGESVDSSLMKDIISGPLDADKQDYLLRDSYFCGVKYGIYDYYRLINTLNKIDEDGDLHLCIDADGINTLEQFVLAKYYMTTQVYRHKVRLVTDAMITRGIELGIEKDELSWLKKLYSYKRSEAYLKTYMEWNDERLICELIYNTKKGYANKIFQCLSNRKLYKTIFKFKIKDLNNYCKPQIVDLLSNITKKGNKKRKREIEQDISKMIVVDPNLTIANSYTIKNVREMSRDDSEGSIIVSKDSTRSAFEEESTVFHSINTKLNDKYFEVYAPLEFKDEREKSKKLKTYSNEILKYFSEMEG